MATSEQACRHAVMAAQEVVLENCEGTKGAVEEVGEDVFAFIPDDDLEAFGADIDAALSSRERDRAVDACVDSAFADRWADGVVGEDADRQVREQARRQVCESLFS